MLMSSITSYNPHEWSSGELITDTWLNHIEDGIFELNEEVHNIIDDISSSFDVLEAAVNNLVISNNFDIRAGTNVATEGVKSGYMDLETTFDTPFPVGSTPIVVASMGANNVTNSNAAQVSIYVLLGSITNEGFTTRIFNNTATSINPTICYIAIA